jgi:hypothetical protein
MEEYSTHIGLDQPVHYVIKIQGRLERDLSSWFLDEPSFTCETGARGAGKAPDPVTVINGWVVDQAGLHGLLSYIRDLGLVLLQIDCLTGRQAQGDEQS